MVEEGEIHYEKGDSGAADIEKIEAGRLKNGALVMMKDHPCKVVSFSTAKTGKHGSAKAMVSGIDIFTSSKYECTFGSGDMIDRPVLVRTEYTVLDICEDGFVHLMNDKGEMKEDLKVPEDDWLKEESTRIRAIFKEEKKECIVIVFAAMGQEKIVGVREGNDL